MPFILEIYQGKGGHPKAVVVDDTLYCAVCKPRDAPVVLEALE